MRYEPRGLALSAIASSLIVVIGVGSFVLLWTRRDEFVSVHQPWAVGADGDPMPFAWALLFALMTCTGMPLFLIALGLINDSPRQTSKFATGIATFFAVLLYGTIWSQRGLAPEQIGTASLLGPLLAAIGATVGISGLMTLIARRLRVPADEPTKSKPESGPKEQVEVLPRYDPAMFWTGRTRISWLVFGQVAAIAAFMAVSVQGALVTGSLVLVAINVLVGVVALLRAPYAMGRLQIMPGLLVLRGGGFITWYRIELLAIESHSVTQVEPRPDFGGLGLRAAPNRVVGYVTGRGSALRIVPLKGPTVVIPLRDAESANRVLKVLMMHRWDGPA